MDILFFWKVLNTCDYTKVPQNRERTFMIAFKDEVNWRSSPKGYDELKI